MQGHFVGRHCWKILNRLSGAANAGQQFARYIDKQQNMHLVQLRRETLGQPIMLSSFASGLRRLRQQLVR
jgi:hypothetical protein